MNDTEESFFEGKRPWSRIKDRILGNYMRPYLRKVSILRRPILIADCFAGPGSFADGAIGSPLIICSEAESQVRGGYAAVFVNSNEAHHAKLTEVLRGFIDAGSAMPILGNAQDFLASLNTISDNSTVLVYLDPFGLKGCEFNTIAAILNRGSDLSTEILINMSMPTLHRLAARNSVAGGNIDGDSIKWRHNLLTSTLGGDFWKDVMFAKELSAQQREAEVMEEYRARLKTILPFAGSCPIQEARASRVKYYMTFCSRHPDAMTLMNDIMLDSYFGYLSDLDEEDIPLFKGSLHWKDDHKLQVHDRLKSIVWSYIDKSPGHIRNKIWEMIVENHFMAFRKSEYHAVVDELFAEGLIDTPTLRATKRLNDNCVLIPGRREDYPGLDR